MAFVRFYCFSNAYFIFIEPIHELYLNVKIGWVTTKFATIEPIHELYLNSS